MSIASQIQALTTDSINIRTALMTKGIEVGGHGFDDFADDIEQIETVKTIAIPVFAGGAVYTGSVITAQFAGYNSETMDISGVYTATNVGTYTAMFTPKEGYKWTDDTYEVKSVAWNITKANCTVTAPTANTLTYNDSAQYLMTTGSVSGGTMYYDTNNGSWSTTRPSSTNVGSWTVRYKVVGDSNHNDVAITSVGTAKINAANLSGASIASVSEVIYTGSAQTPTPTVTWNGRSLSSSTEFTYSYSNNTNVGTATITATGKGNFTGTKSTTFSILSNVPAFTYSGAYTLIDDGSLNWRIKFTSSGTLKFTNLGKGNGSIDIFCVGGGGSGYNSGDYYGGGGGGGYTDSLKPASLAKNTSYSVTVGEAGSSSSFASLCSASGGGAGGGTTGGNGGSGGGGNANNSTGVGPGGSDGSNGGGAGPGIGQGTTTREFGESGGTLYSGGGGAGRLGTSGQNAGGSGGGGAGALMYSGTLRAASSAGGVNTGGGGGGRAYFSSSPGSGGGSGIVVIRNHR